jgi:hypothetical protein
MPTTQELEQQIAEVMEEQSRLSGWVPGAEQAAIERLLAPLRTAGPAVQMQFILAATRTLRGLPADRSGLAIPVNKAVAQIYRRKLPWTESQIVDLLEAAAAAPQDYPYAGLLGAAAQVERTPSLVRALEGLRSNRWLQSGYAESKTLLARIDTLVLEAPPPPVLSHGAWSRMVIEAAQKSPCAAMWKQLFEHGATFTGSQPSKKWRVEAARLVQGIGPETFRAALLEWLAAGPTPGATGIQTSVEEGDFIRGVLWALPEVPDPSLCAPLASFAEKCLKKIPMLGPVSQKAANASVNVLAAMPGLEPVSQLARLSLRIRYQTARRLVEEALEAAAERNGVSREELEEMTVPAYGLDANGERAEVLGCAVAHLSAAHPSLAWTDSSGKPIKSVPAAIQRDFADDLKELKAAAKDIEKMVAAQRLRLERLLLSERGIPLDSWRAFYIGHPLVQHLARRLIWSFHTPDGVETGIWHEGHITSWNGETLHLPTGARVRLWHPVHSSVQTVLSWRCWLEDHQVQQPFKQAHREVYLPTDAERETRSHSNRFAGHILRQHPFHALAEQRGWRFRLMGAFDSHNTPRIELPAYGLAAELRVTFAPEDDPQSSAHGIYLYLSTGQVRFLRNERPVPVDEVPPAAFSEILRDVDLFVSVASIGADPTWTPDRVARFEPYWERFSFGDLSHSAQERRGLIEALLPKLSIRDCCRLEDRFLVVEGKRATYKIHLGSGNVLIEPGSRYLCIVRGPSQGGLPANIFLPFDGDLTLSLILSKAILLATDDKITDPSILRQLPR